MSKRPTAYWAVTLLFCLAMTASGTMNLMGAEEVRESSVVALVVLAIACASYVLRPESRRAHLAAVPILDTANEAAL